ncbi:HepT-like ribonuclease domain-containing protein [Hymenobacter cheonanensis]|uniref:HepT-like ribonuclease domain-containing protein n=1 Tax=Hymenobacter sp. CA2-7 TaxID=3063993 RepID=UPI0035107FA5
MDFAGFCANALVVDGVVRNLEVIGEAAKKVPTTVQELYPQLPWSQMYRMRNRISHEYFGLDLATVWRVATAHMPQNYPDLLRVLAAERARLGQGTA